MSENDEKKKRVDPLPPLKISKVSSLMRGGEFYDFHQLSGGMKEQLAAALRLSIADVLKGSHDDCLPLVFDDAFTTQIPNGFKS